MKHLLLIDPLEKLNYKKDTSLMLAATMKQQGMDVGLLFEKDFYLFNKGEICFQAYDFEFSFKEDGAYLEKFELKKAKQFLLHKGDVIHMRLDPPFDSRYLRYLWMLRFYEEKGIVVCNSASGILKYNEKLHAYAQKSSAPSFVGMSIEEFENFCEEMISRGYDHLILKPLDLFQGMGVVKVSLENNPSKEFKLKLKEYQGPVVAQPFIEEVKNGEIRSIYFNGKELGSILKIPKSGEFLANIAQGASFSKVDLNPELKKECDRICEELLKEGVRWVAFDILHNHVSEVNITCPGLLVEVSYAHQRNLAIEIAESF